MKTIYRVDSEIVTFYFKDGKHCSIEGAERHYYRFQYGELDKKYISEEISGGEASWDYIIEQSNFINDFKGYKTRFNKRLYLTDCRIHGLYIGSRIYKDTLEKITYTKAYGDYSNNLPSIKTLEEDLGFKDYSEFVFMREQELKSMLLKNN